MHFKFEPGEFKSSARVIIMKTRGKSSQAPRRRSVGRREAKQKSWGREHQDAVKVPSPPSRSGYRLGCRLDSVARASARALPRLNDLWDFDSTLSFLMNPGESDQFSMLDCCP